MAKDEKINIRSLTKRETKARRSAMVIKVLSFHIQKNKLSKVKKSYLKLIQLEAKYYYNYLIFLSQHTVIDDFGNIVYPHNVFEFDTKPNNILIFNHSDNTYVDYELKVLSSQVKQELLKKIQSSIKAISAAKLKGRKTGKLKFKSIVNIPFKQFNNSFYLSDDCRKLSLQGNKKSSFHLVKNRNLSKLSKELKLEHHGKVSLKKLIDLNIIEIANTEIVPNFNNKYTFNLTLYFNPDALKKANLFQGTQLTKSELELFQSTNIGIDSGIASELTVNCGEKYNSVSINSRVPTSKFQSNKLKKLKKYQKKFNRNIAKSKNNNPHGKVIRGNTYYSIKNKIDKIQNNINNHKLDSVRKLDSLLSLFKGITFQDEMIKSWHANKTMKFSNAIQKGILGKTYAKLKYHYDANENKTEINGTIEYKYKKLSSRLRTTKTCICGIVNKNITLKDREYICLQCGYVNDRDTHSSYIINHTLNHVEFDMEKYIKEITVCGTQSVDQGSLILDSNLGETITNATTELIYQILYSKLKSNNLLLKYNQYSNSKPNLEASSFRAR